MEFQSQNARTGKLLDGRFREATTEEIDAVLTAAGGAFRVSRTLSAEVRARLLEQIALEVEGLGEELIETADVETALGRPRLEMERGRACAGARMFAELIREGSWVDARIDVGDPERLPVPRPDMRLMHRPLGPVVVFGASNFPLAISVVGTDTISALAAGCPVVVKAHPAHPHTSELLAGAVAKALGKSELPAEMFGMVQGRMEEAGRALVEHPLTEVVAFTGSLAGGRALADIAQGRARPIPFYGEMGSLNPVFLLPGALAERQDEIASGYVGALTMGTGQFCTNPALVLGFGTDPGLDRFLEGVKEEIVEVKPSSMLHRGIHRAFEDGVKRIGDVEGVEIVAQGGVGDAERGEATAVVFQANVEQFEENRSVLGEEVFGPSSVVLRCGNEADMLRFAESMSGSLSATVHGNEEDFREYAELLEILSTKVGRLIVNGYPTGLEVCSALHHGGPYPAATHAGFTSVGTNSVYRFVRPVCYQNVPESSLPEELKNENGRGIWRMIDGVRTKDSISE